MDILFNGNLDPISKGFFKKIAKEHKVVVCDTGTQLDYEKLNVEIYNYNGEEEEFERIFKTFHFQHVVYVSKAIDGAKKVFDELELLESTIYMCKKYNVPNFTYITANDFEAGSHQNDYDSSRYVLQKACEKLCLRGIQKNNSNITIIRVPYVYNSENQNTQLGTWIKFAIKEKKIYFRGAPEDEVDFLWDEDLGILISRIIDEPPNDSLLINISGMNPYTYYELGEKIKENLPDVILEYKNKKTAIPQYVTDTQARKEFGWFPLGNLEEQLPEIIAQQKEALNKRKKRGQFFFKDRKTKFYQFLSVAFEMLIFFILIMLLEYKIAENTLLSFLDFRLLFVIIMGTMRGLNAGIIAAAMACIGYVANSTINLQWQILFYNVQNWVPFAAYFLVGSMTGYSNDKDKDTIKFLQKEQEAIENKYIFLNELYIKVVESNEKFNSQIIGYKDSYGKIYSVIKKLESTMPDKVFYEAINALEDMLENHFVAIYTVNEKSDFARLNICSKSLNEVLGKSIKLSEFSEMLPTLYQGEIWINTDGLKNYPAYGTAIIRDKQVVGLIFLMQVTAKYLNLEFSNKFSIITGLIKDSLIRAISRAELFEKDIMIPDTKILKKEQFQDLVEIKKQMKEKEFSDYLLIRLIFVNMTLPELSNIISGLIRNNDFIGEGYDGEIYLLLSQANIRNISIIAKRLENNKIQYELINT